MCIGVSKTLPPPFSGQAPPLPHPPSPLNVKIVQTLSILGNHHLSILLFHEPRPPKGQIFHWTPKTSLPHKKNYFFILNPSYLLKVTKFLVKTYQFEFFKIFLFINFFLSLNISDFCYFLCKNCNPPEKVTRPPYFPANPSKSWGPVKPPLYENFVGGSASPPAEREGCTLWFLNKVSP